MMFYAMNWHVINVRRHITSVVTQLFYSQVGFYLLKNDKLVIRKV